MAGQENEILRSNSDIKLDVNLRKTSKEMLELKSS